MADTEREREANGVSTGDMSAWKRLYDEFQRVDDVLPEGATTSEEFAVLINRSPNTARNVLNRLVRTGKATKHSYNLKGGGVGNYYVVADRG